MPCRTSFWILQLSFYITHSRSERVFRAHFGLPSLCFEILWKKIRSSFPILPKRWGIEELFMSLYFLKTPGVNLESTASRFHVHKQTLMKKLKITLEIIDSVLPSV